MRLLLFIVLAFAAMSASATVVLAEHQEWRIEASGFIEGDLTQDSRPSFMESAGNYAVQGPYAPAGETGRARKEISLRNSRLGFTVRPTAETTWKPKAYVEFDFLGNRSTWGLGGSESEYFNPPSLRFRHYYLSVEHEGWQFLTGQYWTLLGWGPNYFITTASVAPGPGVIYQRTRQVTAIRKLDAGADGHVQLAFAFEKASQKAGGIPNLEAGVRYSYDGRRSGFASASGDAKPEPLSVALTGTLRQFGTGDTDSTSDKFHKVRAGAVALALDTLIPVIPSEVGQSTSHTLTLTAETSAGTGYGDAFPGWSANLPSFPYNAATDQTYLSEGQGGFDSRGDFHLFKLFTWNAQLQYHWERFFVTLGHSELNAGEVRGLGPIAPGQVAYDQAAMNFINVFHDFTTRLRAAVEYGRYSTHYLDGTRLSSDRYQISAFYRF